MILRVLAAVLGAAAFVPAQAPVFARDVLPVLERACFQCHRGEHTDDSGRVRKPKGGLRLDGRAWIARGGKAGPVLEPGQPLQSPLYTRTVLPADHDDRMPATGEPLAKAETEVLRTWIAGGASFGDWIGAAGPAAAEKAEPAKDTPAAVSRRALDLARVAEGLTPLPEATLVKAAGGRARITPLWFGSALLRVEFPGHEDHVGDAEVAALAPLNGHIAELVLARTAITDAAGAHLARMKRLVRLDLRDTRIGDAGVAKLRGMPELVALNLFATEVSDASADVLATLPKLGELRVWQTKMTPPALAKLAQERPTLDVGGAPELPAPAAPDAQGRGRRRGR